jgi:DNA-binding transcriptional LysR family regulator
MVQNFPQPAGLKEALCWDDVRYFLEVGRQGKLTAAARILGVEHSTVSRRVSALEKQLGIRLFDRLPKSWNLTSEGEELLAHARRIEEEALAFSRAGMGAGALRGSVRISAPPVFASHFMVPRLAALRQRWPGITIEIIGEARQANLYRREADLSVRLSRPEEPGLAAKPLAEMGYGLYAAAGWLERSQDEWEFIGYDEILRETPQQKWLEKLAAGRPFIFRSNDLAAIYQACRAGLGLAVLPHFLAREDPELFPLPESACAVSRTIWMVIHPDVRRSPRVKAVADAIAEMFRKSAAFLM